MKNPSQSLRWTRPVAVVAALFGLVSIFSGGMALFGGTAARAAVGDAVLFVLWFNFLAGFAYVIGAALLFKHSPLASPVAWVIAMATLFVFAILIFVAAGGTAFEWRTIGAMILRSAFWLAIAGALASSANGGGQMI